MLDADQQQSLLYSSDLELGETTKLIFETFERVKPTRVVLDSLSEVRLLAQSSLRYRRQLLALKHYFARHGATVLLLDDRTSEMSDKTPHSVVHGVIQLEELAPDYGAERRRMRVSKYRGQAFRGGYHVAIRTDLQGELTISVSDTGHGPSGDAQRTGMGSRIVQVLTNQLGARVATKRGADGYSVEMTIPVPAKQ